MTSVIDLLVLTFTTMIFICHLPDGGSAAFFPSCGVPGQ
jgi:hypothetical protein